MYNRKHLYLHRHPKVSTSTVHVHTSSTFLSLEEFPATDEDEDEEEEQQSITLAMSDTNNVIIAPTDSTCTAESIDETSPSLDRHQDGNDDDDRASANTDDPDQDETQDDSGDDLHDLPSDFDDDHLIVHESFDNNGDVEFLRSAAKNLMATLSEMQAASAETDRTCGPHSLLYGDDYVVSMKNRRFALAFLEYTQFRVDKQRHPEKFRLLASMKKSPQQKKRDEASSPPPTPPRVVANASVPTMATMTTKKKRNKRNKKKKPTNTSDLIGKIIVVTIVCLEGEDGFYRSDQPAPTPESVPDDDEEEVDGNSVHGLAHPTDEKNDFPPQRLPHVYLDSDMKPCIVVAGEETEQEMSEHDDWHDIGAGGKSAPSSKRTKKKKRKTQPSPQQNEPTSNHTVVEQVRHIPLSAQRFSSSPHLEHSRSLCSAIRHFTFESTIQSQRFRFSRCTEQLSWFPSAYEIVRNFSSTPSPFISLG